MDGSIALSASDRKTLLHIYRSAVGLRSRRAQVVLLAADGWSVRDIRGATFASFDFITQTLRLYRRHGVNGAFPDESPRPLPGWAKRIARWVSDRTPEDFGYFRRRWSCETLAEVLAWETGVCVSAETVRRMLRRLGYVWRRPRPTVGPVDPDHATRLAAIQELLKTLPADETAVFQDEVDVHLNPKIGSCWMKRGQQAEVPTPGNNEKRHLAGSLVWRTGTLIVSPPGTRRNAELFVAHLEDLRCRFRSVRRIHVICDNAAFHKSRRVQDYLREWGHRIVLHFLPRYAPETNPIERIWWQLHETLTRNHRCATLHELLADVYDWIGHQRSFHNSELVDYTTAA
jgi:putative transposase